MAGPWPLVGRAEECNLMLGAVGDRSSRSIVLAGAAGVGKTRLAREVLARAAESGRSVAEVRGTRAGQGMPLAAFGPLLRLPVASPLAARENVQVLQWAREEVVRHAESGQLVLLVDDAHLLDETSALLTYQLVSTGSAFVVVTVRTGLPAPDVIRALWTESIGERIELQPLSQEQVGELVSLVLGGQVDGGAIDVLWHASAGNVLYLRELVVAAVDAERLVLEGGVWELRGSLPTSQRLIEIVEGRLGHLSRPVLEIAEVLAVADLLSFSMLERLAGPSAIDRAERRGVIECDSSGPTPTVRLAHPLYAEVVRTRTSTVRDREIRRLLADELERTGQARTQVMRYVRYRLDSGSPVSADLALAATSRACECFDPRLGERFARAAVEAGGESAAAVALADALHRQGKDDQAMEVLGHIEDRAGGLDESVRTEVALLRATVAFCGLGRTAEAEKLLLDAESVLADPVLKVRLQTMRAMHRNLGGFPGRALELVEPLVGREDLPPQTYLAVLEAAGLSLAHAGRGLDAVKVAERGLDPRLQPADRAPISVGWAVATQTFACWFSGDLDQAERLDQAIYASGITSRHDDLRGIGATALGVVALERGRLTAAIHHLTEALAALSATEWSTGRVLAHGALAQAYAMAGDAVRAEAALTVPAAPNSEAVRWFVPYLEMGRAWASAARGLTSEARSHLVHVAAECAEREQRGFELLAWLGAARLGEARLAASHLVELTGKVDGPLVQAAAAYAVALRDNSAQGLADASAALASIGMTLVAAEAAQAAAAAFESLGLRSRAAREAVRASELLARCEGAPGLSFVEGCGPSELTSREREVAMLAASGMTSLWIAEKLVVSVRTVDSHLARIYAKLGVAGRRQLAEALSVPVPSLQAR